jgi:chlorite dismutase
MPRSNDSLSNRLYRFVAGDAGPWRIVNIDTVVGDPLPAAVRVRVEEETSASASNTRWVLRGVTSNERYVTRTEKQKLVARQEGLGRGTATCAALIPIRKSDAWWSLPQDKRRRIFETRSRHIGIGLDYLPAIARRLHHCRDLASDEPFDFLTWFEFAPDDESLFNELVARLRATEEWKYVEREVDIRLSRADL